MLPAGHFDHMARHVEQFIEYQKAAVRVSELRSSHDRRQGMPQQPELLDIVRFFRQLHAAPASGEVAT